MRSGKGDEAMFQIFNLKNNPNVRVIQEAGPFTVIEHLRDLSVTPASAASAYYASEMNVRKRQLICSLSVASVTIQPGDMQWMVGEVEATTGIKGVGDLLGKAIRGKVTGEAAVKPEYRGSGMVVLEPVYDHILLLDLKEWGGSVVLDDGLFLACDSGIRMGTQMRQSFSSAVAGNEGLFNLRLDGQGIAALESPVPLDELIEVELQNDVLKVDGNFAVAWSAGLQFTVEKAGSSLLGSAASKEGLVNVYRGTGKVLLSPLGTGR